MKITPRTRASRVLFAAVAFAAAAAAGSGDLVAQTTPGPKPSVCSRSCWNARSGSASEMSALNRAVIHHTAGTSDYNVSGITESKSKVRAIQNHHMDGNGWSDIGYHFLVDKLGNTFEGRVRSENTSQRPRGAHDSNNTNSFGFNVMGYYHPPHNQSFTTASRNALWDVIAWRLPSGWSPYGSSTYNGKTVGRVAGHRNVKSTACPGDGVYATIGTNFSGGTARNAIAARRGGGSPPPPPPPPPTGRGPTAMAAEPGTGNVWFAAVRNDGELWSRRWIASSNSWVDFKVHGVNPTWSRNASPALVATPDDAVRLFAVKDDSNRTLYTRVGASGVGWSNFLALGSGDWSTKAGPAAVAQPNGKVSFAAIKASGTLYTNTFDADGNLGSSWTQHGVSESWSPEAQPAMTVGSDGRIWLMAVKKNGRIYVRSAIPGSGWGAFEQFGVDNDWSHVAGPAAAAEPGGNGRVTFAATKLDGTLYTRSFIPGAGWTAFSQRGQGASWAPYTSPGLAWGANGRLWLFAVKKDQRLMHQTFDGSWSAWEQDGCCDDWSDMVGATVVARPNGAVKMSSTKETGRLYTRGYTGGGAGQSFEDHGTGWVR